MNFDMGKRIRDLRGIQRITQTELAKRTGITRQAISDLERGKYQARNSTIEVIAEKGFNMSVDEFIQVKSSYSVVSDFTTIVKELAHIDPDLMISFKDLSEIIEDITPEDKTFLASIIKAVIHKILNNHNSLQHERECSM